MTYKISGQASAPCDVYVFQNKEYIGRHYVPSAGAYDVVFGSTTGANTLAFAQDENGAAVGYGEVTAISSADTATVSGASSGILSIKSIQQGYIALTSGVLTGTYTISSVDTSKAVVEHMGNVRDSTNAGLAGGHISVTLTNATTVTANRELDNSNVPARVTFRVIEYASGVKSIQSGVNYLEPSYTGLNINFSTAVDINKTIFVYRGSPSGREDTVFQGFNTTTQFVVRNGDGNAYLNWTLLEYE